MSDWPGRILRFLVLEAVLAAALLGLSMLLWPAFERPYLDGYPEHPSGKLRHLAEVREVGLPPGPTRGPGHDAGFLGVGAVGDTSTCRACEVRARFHSPFQLAFFLGSLLLAFCVLAPSTASFDRTS